jgi:hypothetical protein
MTVSQAESHLIEVRLNRYRSVVLPVDFTACDDAAMLTIYRDINDPVDTARGGGTIVMVSAVWCDPPISR